MNALADLLETSKGCLKAMLAKGLVPKYKALKAAIEEMEAATKEADGE